MSPYLTTFILTMKQSAALAACVLRATTKKRSSTFFEEKKCTLLTPGDLARGFSDLEMIALLYCTVTATG